MRALLATALVLCGCPEKIGVGGPDSGPSDAEIADAALFDGASADGGTNEGDGGGLDASDAGTAGAPLRFGTMAFPNDQITATTIWGRSTSEIYAGTSNGNVLRFDPANGWQVVWHEPSNFGIARIRGTPQQIFVASEASLHVHGPGIGEGVRSFGAGGFVRDLEVVSDDEAYLVADLTNGRGVFRWDGSDVSLLTDQLDAAVLYGLYRDADGTLFVAANGKIFRYASFTWTQDPIEWPAGFGIADIANFDLYDVARVGDRLFAVGDEHHILEWDGSTWRFVYEPHYGEFLDAIGALTDEEAIAVGRNGQGGPIVMRAGGAWSHVEYSDDHNFYDLWIAGPNEVFAAGGVGSTLEPVILRGFR